VHRLAAAGGEELVHLGCTESEGQVVQARSWWRRAKLRRSASNSSWAALAGGAPSHSLSGSSSLSLAAWAGSAAEERACSRVFWAAGSSGDRRSWSRTAA
jgi:hypothetical protein